MKLLCKIFGSCMMFAGIVYFLIVPIAVMLGKTIDVYAASVTSCVAAGVALAGLAIWSICDEK